MKLFIDRKIAVAVAVVIACLGFSVNKISADVGDSLQINITGRGSGLRFIGLTSNNTLVNIGSSGFGRTIQVQVKGIDGNLQGIDFRPANGLLYGVTDTDNIYTINLDDGQATFVSKLSSSFNGGFQSGFDFNPVPDRLRIVGSNDQNFRTNVDNGQVIVDGSLAYATDDANNGVDPNITAAAYTNSVAGATTTQLFGIDYDLDVLVLQNPPNDGTLKTVGNLGVNFAPISGFDIFTDAQGNNTAYALSGSALYTIDLSTGAASKIADVPRGSFIGLAVTSR
ncbi:MAG: DUF4394 domain-containing protein [Iphinoe sp. HA4291-MV1]|jgi:hypothetical protein|nr:DUF4394 domain-containing protein [Iphinoe sp. HA4291-MV1]